MRKLCFRKILLPFILPLIVFTSCKLDDQVIVNGKVNGLKSTVEVKLLRQDFDRIVPLESAKVSPKKDRFSFKLLNISEPTFIQIQFVSGKTNTLILLVEMGEEVELEVDLKDFIDYQVRGSQGSERARLLSRQLSATSFTIDSLSRLYDKVLVPAERALLASEIDAAIDSQRVYSSRHIWANPMCRSSIMALYQQYGPELYVFDRPEDIQLFKVVGSSLKALYPNSNFTQGILRDIANQENIVAQHKLQQLVRDAESTLPEIALPNHLGDTVRLSSYRGKVILLDFWASTNQASLFANRELLDIYDQFKGKGFEVFQVSLDIDKELWVLAIQSAGLPWINVCEIGSEDSSTAGFYNITRIPANYLIDRDFNIVGKDLFGDDLIRKLKEVL